MAKNYNRIGLLGYKLGMTVMFADNGDALPVTLVRLPENVVLDVSDYHDGSKIIGSNKVVKKVPLVDKKLKVVRIAMGECKHLKKPLVSLAKNAGINSFAHSKSFNVINPSADNDFSYKVGDKFGVSHFTVGQFIDVSAVSIGKGFAGSMKRHNFSGLEASHGVSISHRAHGSTGQRQDPGKVFKGKKMAGHMGAKKVTVQNLRVVDCDTELNIIVVKGCIPGAKNSLVLLRDACKKGIVL